MKKLLALLLALAMCASLAACGGGDDTPAPAASGGGNTSEPAAPSGGDASSAGSSVDPADVSTPVEDKGDYCANYAVLDTYTLYEILPMDRLTASPWNFSGGYNASNGAEMEQEELDSILAVYGGKMQVEFADDGTANLVQGGGAIPGTYRVLDDGASINFTFTYQDTIMPFVGVFTAIGEDETPVLLFLSPDAPDTVFYMTNP